MLQNLPRNNKKFSIFLIIFNLILISFITLIIINSPFLKLKQKSDDKDKTPDIPDIPVKKLDSIQITKI